VLTGAGAPGPSYERGTNDHGEQAPKYQTRINRRIRHVASCPCRYSDKAEDAKQPPDDPVERAESKKHVFVPQIASQTRLNIHSARWKRANGCASMACRIGRNSDSDHTGAAATGGFAGVGSGRRLGSAVGAHTSLRLRAPITRPVPAPMIVYPRTQASGDGSSQPDEVSTAQRSPMAPPAMVPISAPRPGLALRPTRT
jgi:hypothetical protein